MSILGNEIVEELDRYLSNTAIPVARWDEIREQILRDSKARIELENLADCNNDPESCAQRIRERIRSAEDRAKRLFLEAKASSQSTRRPNDNTRNQNSV